MVKLGDSVAGGLKAEPGAENNMSGNVSPNNTANGGRILTEQEAELNPFREMDSVMMTSSGFISPAREGRLPDANRPAVSSLAAQALSLDAESATPPATPTPPNQGQVTPNAKGNATTRKRGPVPGSKHKRKKDTNKPAIVDDSPDDLSGDETYEPPPGTITVDKKLSVFQRKPKPRKSSPTKTADIPKHIAASSEGHVDDVISKVIERGIEESSRLQPTPFQNTSPAVSTITGLSPGITQAPFLPAKSSPSAHQQTPSSTGKKRGRKRKSEQLKIKAEKAAKEANQSDSSDIDICYDAPIRKKPTNLDKRCIPPEPPIELKIPQAPTLPPDPSILFNNPLIPKVPYGFGDLSAFNVPSMRPAVGTVENLQTKAPEVSSLVVDKHEKKKDKSSKKSKKDKKARNKK